MGRMKEVFMDICRENKGQLPKEITVGDVARMKELEIYNWEEYERELAKNKKEAKYYKSEKSNNNKKKKEDNGWSPGCPF